MAQSSDAFPINALLGAMKSPVPVGIAIATVIGGIIISPWLLPAGVAAWLVATGVSAARQISAGRPPDISHLPPSIQAELLAVGEALDELQKAAISVPAHQRPMFEGIEQEAEEMRDAVLRLGLTAGDLHRHLEAHRPEEMGERLDYLRSRLTEDEDSRALPEIEHKISTLERRMERREELMERLAHYRSSIRSLQTTCQDLANRATDLATARPKDYDYDEEAPERRMSEMKASVAALEEVMRRDTNVIQ